MSDDELFKTLNGELDIIREEIVDLRVKQHIYWELQKIIGANPKINVVNEFYDWTEEIYSASMLAAIRRQVDGRKDSVSFRRFLDEVERRPCVVTRKRYSTFFTSRSVDSIKSDFDGLVGAGRDHIDPLEVKRDSETLKGKADALKDYANTWITHRAKVPHARPTSFADVDEAIGTLEILVKKYLHLFRSYVVQDGLLPTSQDNWKAIFGIPWIAPPHR